MAIRHARVVFATIIGLSGLAERAEAALYECIGVDGKSVFQDRPCAAGQRSKKIERAKPEGEQAEQNVASPPFEDDAKLEMPGRGDLGRGIGFRVATSELRSGLWLDAIALASQQPSLLTGNGQLTLFRVLLEGAESAEIQLQASKLKGPGEESGGGRYRDVSHGDFVLMEHINSSSRKDGNDLLTIGSLSHGTTEIRVPVPAKGALAVLGDVILSAASAEEMSVLEVTIDTGGMQIPPKDLSMILGPIAVGGRYGEKIAFDSAGRARRVSLAPGTYKIALPNFDIVKSRFTIDIGAGERLRVRFRAKNNEVVELLHTDREPVPASTGH